MSDGEARPAGERAAEFYRQAFLATDDPAIITDEQFEIIDVNEACLRMGDWEREALIGGYPHMLFDDASLFEDAVETLLDGDTWTREFEAVAGDGRRMYGRGTAAPIRVDGEVQGYVAIFLDLTSRRKHEESLRVLNRVLRHNLRNDANVVLGHLETVAEQLENEGARESLSVATQRIRAILDRARTTREFSRLLVERENPTFYPVSVADALRQAVNTVDTDDADVRLDADGDVYVLADETVTAALRNVVENAVQHAGDAPVVEVGVEADDEHVTVRVADDGPGIDPERRDRVLERGGTDVHHGEGLGLFFVDRLMEVYGGRLAIDDSELGGCLVELTFSRTNPENHGLE